MPDIERKRAGRRSTADLIGQTAEKQAMQRLHLGMAARC